MQFEVLFCCSSLFFIFIRFVFILLLLQNSEIYLTIRYWHYLFLFKFLMLDSNPTFFYTFWHFWFCVICCYNTLLQLVKICSSSDVKLLSDCSSSLLIDESIFLAALNFLDLFKNSSLSVLEVRSEISSASFNFRLATI